MYMQPPHLSLRDILLILFTLYLFTSFILTVEEYTLSAQSNQTWEVRGYIWNPTLKEWARSDCSLPLGTASTDCAEASNDKNRLRYDHRDGGKLTGSAWSPVFGEIKFDENIPNCPSWADFTPKVIKISAASGEYDTDDEGIRIVGCAHIPLLKTTLVLSPYDKDGNKKTTADLDNINYGTGKITDDNKALTSRRLGRRIC